jgi:GntR family transcriptional regulator
MAKKTTLKGETGSLFQRLQSELMHLITSTPPGERLPTEPELAKQLGVSRATLREAMRSFEGQGLIRRRQGLGTFIISHPHKIDTGLEVLESIETLAKRIQLEVKMGEYLVEQVKADEEQAKALGVAPGTPLVKVMRVIIAENRPVAYLIDVLPKNIFTQEDLGEKFTGSVLDLLISRGEPRLVSSYTEIGAVPATPELAWALEVQRGDTLLLFTARLYTADQQAVDYSLSYFLPGYFRFHVVRKIGAEAK